MKTIVPGASGMVGAGALREALGDPGVESVLSITKLAGSRFVKDKNEWRVRAPRRSARSLRLAGGAGEITTNLVVLLSHSSGKVLVCGIHGAGKHFGFARAIHSGANRTRVQ